MRFLGPRMLLKGLLLAFLIFSSVNAIDLDLSDERTLHCLEYFPPVEDTNGSRTAESIKDAASTTIYAMMTYYKGNETGHIPGAFASKWWEGSALLMALLQYWHFTGDTTYNDELRVALQWQSGDDGDYMPANYSSYLVSSCSTEARCEAD